MNEFFKKINTPIEISEIVLFIIAFACLIIILVGLLKDRRSGRIRLVAFYVFLILLQLLIKFYILYKDVNGFGKHSITNISAYVFIILEYLILAYLIGSSIKTNTARKWLSISSAVFVVVAVFNWYLNNNFRKIVSLTTTIEAIPLIVACLYFFYKILKGSKRVQLHKESSFWIVSGILFLFICIAPFYSAFEYFKLSKLLILDSLGYSIITILFTRASLCEETETSWQ